MSSVAKALELLISGEFVCPYSNKELYKTIMSNKGVITDTLSAFERELKQTSRSSAYYVVYKQMTPANSAVIKKSLQDIHNSIRPTVSLIALVTEAQGDELTLTSGDELSPARLTDLITSSSSCLDRLDSICRHPSVKNRKNPSNVREKVNLLFDFMKKHGLIQLAHKEHEIYVVTGKIDYIYETLEFIDSRENIVEQINQERQQQGDFGF